MNEAHQGPSRPWLTGPNHRGYTLVPLFGRMSPWSSCSTTSCFRNEWGMNLPHFGRSFTWWACSAPSLRVSCLCVPRWGEWRLETGPFWAVWGSKWEFVPCVYAMHLGFDFFTKGVTCFCNFFWCVVCSCGTRGWRATWSNPSVKQAEASCLRYVWFLANKILHRLF